MNKTFFTKFKKYNSEAQMPQKYFLTVPETRLVHPSFSSHTFHIHFVKFRLFQSSISKLGNFLSSSYKSYNEIL